MTSKISLLHEMAEHMEYMQSCLKACHELDEWDDYHWFRRSEELLARAVDVYATELVKEQALAILFRMNRVTQKMLEELEGLEGLA